VLQRVCSVIGKPGCKWTAAERKQVAEVIGEACGVYVRGEGASIYSALMEVVHELLASDAEFVAMCD
jgi:hypothetical protein